MVGWKTRGFRQSSLGHVRREKNGGGRGYNIIFGSIRIGNAKRGKTRIQREIKGRVQIKSTRIDLK